jgi:hypothetical protein
MMGDNDSYGERCYKFGEIEGEEEVGPAVSQVRGRKLTPSRLLLPFVSLSTKPMKYHLKVEVFLHDAVKE